MNERIRELIKEADRRCSETRGVYDEILAELVVRECIGVLNKRYMGDNNREDFEVRRCVEDLKKHFGVE